MLDSNTQLIHTGKTNCDKALALCSYTAKFEDLKQVIPKITHILLRHIGWQKINGHSAGFLMYHTKGAHKKEGERLFIWADCDRTRGNGFKVKEDRFRQRLGRNS